MFSDHGQTPDLQAERVRALLICKGHSRVARIPDEGLQRLTLHRGWLAILRNQLGLGILTSAGQADRSKDCRCYSESGWPFQGFANSAK
jgi:hypothetical protein